MTAEAFAALVEARRTGAGRWMAHCPAHADRSPSLSIRDGEDGRVLVHCFAGCANTAILAALGLGRRDLYAGPPPSTQQAAALRAAREARERAARIEGKARRDAWNAVRKWEGVVKALGSKLARTPDDAPGGDSLTALFHQACERLHAAEITAEQIESRAKSERGEASEQTRYGVLVRR
jgi:hypothetical protein